MRFLFPSSIAVYGLPDAASKREAGSLKEWMWNTPTNIYGCNKLYCELVGNYLPATRHGEEFDFRAIRFPGLISAETIPSGGTTDYAPEMIHAAAKGEAYSCFVSEESTLPFMTMPDAIDALMRLALAGPGTLSTPRVQHQGLQRLGRRRSASRCSSASRTLRSASIRSRCGSASSTPGPPTWTMGMHARTGDCRRATASTAAFDDYLMPSLMRRYGRAD